MPLAFGLAGATLGASALFWVMGAAVASGSVAARHVGAPHAGASLARRARASEADAAGGPARCGDRGRPSGAASRRGGRRCARPPARAARRSASPADTGRSTAGANRAGSRRRRGTRSRRRCAKPRRTCEPTVSVGASRAAGDALERLDVLVADDLALAERNAALLQELARRDAGLARAGRGVERHRVLRRRLAQLERQVGLGRLGPAPRAPSARDAALGWRSARDRCR